MFQKTFSHLNLKKLKLEAKKARIETAVSQI